MRLLRGMNIGKATYWINILAKDQTVSVDTLVDIYKFINSPAFDRIFERPTQIVPPILNILTQH
jgi:hypothetical protein